MIKIFRDTNRYLILLTVGIVSFLNSDLYFGDIVQSESEDLILGVNSITKWLIIIVIFLLLSILPMTDFIKKMVYYCFAPFVWMTNKFKEKDFEFTYEIGETLFVSICSYLSYFILIGSLILYALLL